MEKSIETQASSVDLAVEKALVELGVSKDKVDVEVVSKGGLFSKAKVRVTVKDSVADKMAEFFNGTLSRMGLVSRATVEDKNGTLYVTISGDDSGVAIGYRGEALDAFQYLALTFLNEQKCDFKKVVVDCENYREKRRETLTALALKLAQKALRLQKPQATAKNPIVISSSSPRVLSSKTNAPLKTAKESRKRTARKAAEILAEATARISKAEEIRASVNPERKRPKRRTEEFIAVISPSKTIS